MPNNIFVYVFKMIKNKLLFGVKFDCKYNILKNKKTNCFMKGCFYFTKRIL